MKAAALRGALSDRARAGRVHVIEALVEGYEALHQGRGQGPHRPVRHAPPAVILEREDALTWLSLRNVAGAHILAVDQLNTYDVLLSDDVVFTKGAYDAFVSGLGARLRDRSGHHRRCQLRARSTPPDV